MAAVDGAASNAAGARPSHRSAGILDLERPPAAVVPQPVLADSPSPCRRPRLGQVMETGAVVAAATAAAAVCSAVCERDGLRHRPDVFRGVADGCGAERPGCCFSCCAARGNGSGIPADVGVGIGILERLFGILVVAVVAGTVREKTGSGWSTRYDDEDETVFEGPVFGVGCSACESVVFGLSVASRVFGPQQCTFQFAREGESLDPEGEGERNPSTYSPMPVRSTKEGHPPTKDR